MVSDQITFPKHWKCLTGIELIWSINEPEEQEALVRFLMTKYMYKSNLIYEIEKESRKPEIKELRLSILSILADNEELYIDNLRPLYSERKRMKNAK